MIAWEQTSSEVELMETALTISFNCPRGWEQTSSEVELMETCMDSACRRRYAIGGTNFFGS